jgi:hypothetical protein
MHEEHLFIDDIEISLPPVFDRFHASERSRECRHCGHRPTWQDRRAR